MYVIWYNSSWPAIIYSLSQEEILVQGGGCWLQWCCWSRGGTGRVERGGVPVDTHGYVSFSTSDPWLRGLSLHGAARWSPCWHCGPGSHGWARPLTSLKTLLLPPRHGSGRVRWSSILRAPYWVCGEYGEDLRAGECRLWRLWEHRRGG